MKLHNLFFICIAAFSLIVVLSCSEKQANQKQLKLDDRYLRINDIIAIADCSGPRGKYVTEVHSYSDGSCYFIQKNNIDSSSFIVKTTSLDQGFIIDSNDKILDTISKETIVMIKGHEIHKMQTNPSFFFSNIEYQKTINQTGQDYEVYSGLDQLDNDIRIFYDRTKEHLSKIELINPMDTTQIIQIINKKWMDTEYGKMVKEADIVQAEKDTFNFVFNTVEINP